MKNIHVLPTDKPSSLYFSGNNSELLFLKGHIFYRAFGISPQSIYITSDEEIKEGDWYIFPLYKKGFTIKRYNSVEHFSKEPCISLANLKAKKIILTTDQDLIKDGVQAIDDEFLEWFVKNPSCERVEVKSWIKTYEDGSTFDRMDYEIIIPKEETKPNSFCETPEEKCTMNYCDENGCQNRKRELVEPKPKQETLEDFIIENGERIAQLIIAKHERAEWKLQQLYSEEKIDKILQKLEEIKIMINIR